MRLNSGPGLDSWVNAGLVSLSNLDASFQFSFKFFLAPFWRVIRELKHARF